MWITGLAVVVGCLYVVLVSSSLYDDVVTVVDLSHQLDSNSVLFPGNPPFNFTILSRGINSRGLWYEANSFATAEHAGTHFDAPSHFAQGNWRAHQIPADRLVGPGVIIDVRDSVATNPDYRITIEDVQDWERRYGIIPDGAVVMMLSGWSSRYPNPNLVFGTDNITDMSTFHFPGFDITTANWLIQNRNMKMLGVDAPSLDYGQRKTPQVHMALGRSNLVGLAAVNNLEKVPPRGSIIVAGALKLYDGSAGPVRILALIGQTEMSSCFCPANDDHGYSNEYY